jgi:inactivated superfamily I helicase
MGRRIERVRGVATDILESAAEPDVKERANGWLNRADGLRRSLAAVQALTARDQRKLRLDLIQNALDELIAEMISGGLGGPMTPDAEG